MKVTTGSSQRESSIQRGLVLYDFLQVRGGAESVTLDLAHTFEADLCCDFVARRHFTATDLHGLRIHELGRPTRIPALNTLRGLWDFRYGRRCPSGYDWALFSGSNAPVAAHRHLAQRNLYYCHTIPRFAYDLYDYYLDGLSPWMVPAFAALARLVRRQYARALDAMDLIIANSENVRGRLRTYLGRDALVVHPPVDTRAFEWMGQEGFYLSTARLETFKRVDVIIDAFRRMPDKQLVVASGGSQRAALEQRAGGAPNIRFAGWTDDRELRRLVGRCIATLYLARDEDFGMSPVESMAAGKPVIGIAEGGLLETVVPDRTGMLLSPKLDVEDVIAAVCRLTPERALGMREDCVSRAAHFDRERFFERIGALIRG